MSQRKRQILPERIPASASAAIGRGVGRLGITPNMITLAGVGGSGVAAWLITEERLLIAGAVFLGFSAMDFVDGAVARATGRNCWLPSMSTSLNGDSRASHQTLRRRPRLSIRSRTVSLEPRTSTSRP